MAGTLARTRALLVEVSDLARGASSTPLKDLVDFLDARGFDVYRVGADALVPLWGEHYHPIFDEWRRAARFRRGAPSARVEGSAAPSARVEAIRRRKYWSNVYAVRRGGPLAEDAWACADVSGLDPALDAALAGEGE